MTDSNNSEIKTSNPPSHIAYQVRESANKKGFWNRIGSAWAHNDGKGFNIQLECLPIDGRITLRIASDRKD